VAKEGEWRFDRIFGGIIVLLIVLFALFAAGQLMLSAHNFMAARDAVIDARTAARILEIQTEARVQQIKAIGTAMAENPHLTDFAYGAGNGFTEFRINGPARTGDR
jgi:hypothetical protein